MPLRTCKAERARGVTTGPLAAGGGGGGTTGPAPDSEPRGSPRGSGSGAGRRPDDHEAAAHPAAWTKGGATPQAPADRGAALPWRPFPESKPPGAQRRFLQRPPASGKGSSLKAEQTQPGWGCQGTSLAVHSWVSLLRSQLDIQHDVRQGSQPRSGQKGEGGFLR